jgi:hypothetical protein
MGGVMGCELRTPFDRQKRLTTQRRGDTRVPEEAAEPAPPTRLCPISAKIGHALSNEIDAYAAAKGITRSHAAADYLDIASETLRERQGIPGGRADELLEVLDAMAAMLDILGPPTLGILRLLAHWATQGGGVEVNEDELLAEVRAVGADEWEQATAEAERRARELAPPTAEGPKTDH